MPTPNLPKTSVRLSTSTSFYVLREDAISLASFFGDIFSPRTSILEVQNEMIQIFGLTSFQEREERGTQSRWELDSNILGEPLEALIGPVDRTFTIRRPVFYGSDIIKIFGFEEELSRGGITDPSILAQQLRTPFIFIKVEAAPADTGFAKITTLYRGCAFSNINRSYGVENPDIAVTEDASIRFSGKQQFKQ